MRATFVLQVGAFVFAVYAMVSCSHSDGAGDATQPGSPPTTGSTGIPRSSTSAEQCNNGLDDDGDGYIDEGCSCDVGATQPCWSKDKTGESLCQGKQTCASVSESLSWGECDLGDACVLPACLLDESGKPKCEHPSCSDDQRCGGDACRLAENGQPDCTDLRCATNPACTKCGGDGDPVMYGRFDFNEIAPDEACADGKIKVYTRPSYLVGVNKLVTVLPGDTERLVTYCIAASSCPAGQVAVQADNSGQFYCVPAPTCPAGQKVDMIGTSRFNWCQVPRLVCSPCEMVVEYSKCDLHHQRICAPKPNVTCASDEIPTFRDVTRTWECKPVTNCGMELQIGSDVVAGAPHVCIPCAGALKGD